MKPGLLCSHCKYDFALQEVIGQPLCPFRHFLREDLPFSFQPIFEIVAVFMAALDIEFIRPFGNSGTKIFIIPVLRFGLCWYGHRLFFWLIGLPEDTFRLGATFVFGVVLPAADVLLAFLAGVFFRLFVGVFLSFLDGFSMDLSPLTYRC